MANRSADRPVLNALEFFAGGGLARLGLERDFTTLWANDIDPMKAAAWRENFGDGLREGDVWDLDPAELPGPADLAWASFPCQDLSLAGARGGMASARSGAFWGFARVLSGLAARGQAPSLVVVENVSGLLTSADGSDFAALLGALDALGYRAGALELDAAHFVPQSRPRLFVVAALKSVALPAGLRLSAGESGPGHTASLAQALASIPAEVSAKHVRWSLPIPPARNAALADMLDDEACCWWSPEKTEKLVGQLPPAHRALLDGPLSPGQSRVAAVYRRMRDTVDGRVQRAEARFDGLAGCLRTPSGGSSRQFIIVNDGAGLRARALGAREAMRLMGVPDSYRLPASQSAGLKIAGDGVCVPLVAWLSRHLLMPLAQAARGARRNEAPHLAVDAGKNRELA